MTYLFGVVWRLVGAAWWTPRLLPAASTPAPALGSAVVSATAGAGGVTPPHWLSGSSLLITGGLGSLGVLFGLWAVQQVIS
jgi:hypothetical protein